MPYLKSGTLAIIAAFVMCSASGSVRTADEQITPAKRANSHSWQKIAYPDLPCPWATKICTPSLHAPREGKTRGLIFRLTFYMPGFFSKEEGEQLVSPEPKQIEVRLHYT